MEDPRRPYDFLLHLLTPPALSLTDRNRTAFRLTPPLYADTAGSRHFRSCALEFTRSYDSLAALGPLLVDSDSQCSAVQHHPTLHWKEERIFHSSLAVTHLFPSPQYYQRICAIERLTSTGQQKGRSK